MKPKRVGNVALVVLALSMVCARTSWAQTDQKVIPRRFDLVCQERRITRRFPESYRRSLTTSVVHYSIDLDRGLYSDLYPGQSTFITPFKIDSVSATEITLFDGLKLENGARAWRRVIRIHNGVFTYRLESGFPADHSVAVRGGPCQVRPWTAFTR